MSFGPNGDAKQVIFGLKSKLRRRDEEIARLKERVAVLEVLAQGAADDRDSYAERCAEIEQENADLQQTLQGLKEGVQHAGPS